MTLPKNQTIKYTLYPLSSFFDKKIINKFVNVEDFIAKKISRELAALGVYFKSDDSKLIDIFNEFKKNNKLNSKLLKIIEKMTLYGRAVVTIDSVGQDYEGLRMTIASNNSMIVQAFEDPFYIRLTKNIINTGSSVDSYMIEEVWNRDGKIRRWFYYNRGIVSSGYFFDRVPKEYRFLKTDLIWKTKIDNNNQYYDEAINKLGFIPIQIFELNADHKPIISDFRPWNEAINKVLLEIRRELSTTRSFLTLGGLSKKAQNQLNQKNLEIDVITSDLSSGASQDVKVVNPGNRLIILQQTYDSLMQNLLNQVGLSYNKDISGTAGTSETTSKSDSFNFLNEKRLLINTNLHQFFEKVFNIAGIKKPEFEIYIQDNNALSEGNLTDTLMKEQLLGTKNNQEIAAIKNLSVNQIGQSNSNESNPKIEDTKRKNGQINK